MADMNVALGVQVPDSMKSISGMLNLANQATDYQAKNTELEKNQIMLGERKNIQKLFENPEQFKDANGQMDFNAMINGVMKAAPTTGPTIVPQLIHAHKSATEAEQAFNTLSFDQQKQAAQTIGSLGNTDPKTALEALQQYGETNPRLQKVLGHLTNTYLLPAAQGGPEAWQKATQTVANQVMDTATQANVRTGQMANTGATLEQTSPAALASGGMRSITNTLPPSQRQTTSINPTSGMPQTEFKGAAGNVIGMAPTPVLGGLPQTQPGDVQKLPGLAQHQTDARMAMAAAPDLHNNVRGILKEIDNVSTGVLGPTLQKVFSASGIAADSAEKRASSYDLVGKYLERNAIQTAQTMGPHTNAGLDSVRAAGGSTAYNPTAIKEIAKLVDANVTGTQAYSPGLDLAVKSSPNGVLATEQYQQAWGQNYDPRIMMIQNAKQTGDRAEYDKIIRGMGGLTSPTYRELMRKAQNLTKLSNTGSL